MDLPRSLRIQAHANRLANRRLHAALAKLTRADFHAPRVGFFPSLAATLNHILAVDLYYVGALHGDADLAAHYGSFVQAANIAALAERQRNLAGHVLAHLLMHQTHHRGQAHAMLSGTAIAPPQLAEFLMPSEAAFRSADMAALHWDEAVVYGR